MVENLLEAAPLLGGYCAFEYRYLFFHDESTSVLSVKARTLSMVQNMAKMSDTDIVAGSVLVKGHFETSVSNLERTRTQY